MKLAKNIKLLVVISYAELQAGRGKGFIKLIELFAKLFKSQIQIYKNFIWVITQLPEDIDENDIREQLIGENGFYSTLTKNNSTDTFMRSDNKVAKDNDIIQAQLTIIAAMAQNLNTINVLHADDRKKILQHIEDQKGISISQLSFYQYEKQRMELIEFINNFIIETRGLLSNRSFILKKEQLFQQEILKTQNEIKNDLLFHLLFYKKEHMLLFYEKQKKEENEKLIAIQEQLGTLKSELNDLDTDEEIVLGSLKIKEKLEWYQLRHSFKVFYEEEPFEYYREHIYSGSVTKREVDEKRGLYNATYYSDFRQSVDITVEFFSRKKTRRIMLQE